MKNMLLDFSGLSDADLLHQVETLAADERHATVALVASLAEVDARRLYLGQGFPSMFVYCTKSLRLSESAAYRRIDAARCARRFPRLLDLLQDGDITLTSVSLLAPHLTPENHQRLLDQARRRTRREVEEQIAMLRPHADVSAAVRKLPQPRSLDLAATQSLGRAPERPTRATTPVLPAAQRPTVKPLAPQRYKVQFTIDGDTRTKLQRVQDLLRHTVPNGDIGVVFARALALLLERLERRQFGCSGGGRQQNAVSQRSRHVPAVVRRQVWGRDGGRCAFVGAEGRCPETAFLEFHHVVPFADGGPTTVDNLQLRCRAHNSYEAEAWFGPMTARERAAEYELAPARVRDRNQSRFDR